MVKNVAGVPVRRVSAEFVGDEAVDLEIIEVSLGLNRISRSKSDRDTKLMQVALASLKNSIEQYRSKSGERYPEFGNFAAWLGIDADIKGESAVIRTFSSNTDEPEVLGVAHEQKA